MLFSRHDGLKKLIDQSPSQQHPPGSSCSLSCKKKNTQFHTNRCKEIIQRKDTNGRNLTPRESVKRVTMFRCMALKLLKAAAIILQNLVKFYNPILIQITFLLKNH